MSERSTSNASSNFHNQQGNITKPAWQISMGSRMTPITMEPRIMEEDMEDADDRIIHYGNPWEPWMRDEIVAALKEQGPLYILQQGRFNGEQAAIDEFIRS
jgi:hypothetical protein